MEQFKETVYFALFSSVNLRNSGSLTQFYIIAFSLTSLKSKLDQSRFSVIVKKLTPVFYVFVLLLIINIVTTLSKQAVDPLP